MDWTSWRRANSPPRIELNPTPKRLDRAFSGQARANVERFGFKLE